MARKGKSINDIASQTNDLIRRVQFGGGSNAMKGERQSQISRIGSNYVRNIAKITGWNQEWKKFPRSTYMGLSNG